MPSTVRSKEETLSKSTHLIKNNHYWKSGTTICENQGNSLFWKLMVPIQHRWFSNPLFMSSSLHQHRLFSFDLLPQKWDFLQINYRLSPVLWVFQNFWWFSNKTHIDFSSNPKWFVKIIFHYWKPLFLAL